MKEELAARTVGQLKMISVNFGQDIISQSVSRLVDRCSAFNLKSNCRYKFLWFYKMSINENYFRSLGGGALLDLGCYAVMAANDIFKEKPEKIVASGLVLETGTRS